jgi:ribosomal protein S18 acetylase RimI-like enzyme
MDQKSFNPHCVMTYAALQHEMIWMPSAMEKDFPVDSENGWGARMILRRAGHADLSAIIQLLAEDELGEAREIVQVPPHESYLRAFDVIAADPNQMMMVAEDAGQIVGCLQLTFIPGLSRKGMWRGQIESVRVAGSHRGKSLGRAMFDWAINECRERGCGLVQLSTDKTRNRAHAFYAALGFEASHVGMKLKL